MDVSWCAMPGEDYEVELMSDKERANLVAFIQPENPRPFDLSEILAEMDASGRGENVGYLLLVLGMAATTGNEADIETVAKRLAAAEGRGSISACGLHGLPALHIAAAKGHIDTVHKILALGASVDAEDGKGRRALHLAVQSGRRDVVGVLMVARSDLDAADAEGKTALHYACTSAGGDGIAMPLTLLQNGANAGVADMRGVTPIMLAMENPTLMSHMLDVGTKPGREQAARYVDQCRGSKERAEVFELLVARGWGPRVKAPALTLHQVVERGDAGELRRALCLAKDPDVLDSSGRTPLHVAAHLGNVTAVATLVAAGSALDVKSKPSEWTPLHVASKHGHAKAVEALLDACLSSETFKGVRDKGDDTGRTPLHLAAAHGRVGVVVSLLKGKAVADLRDNNNHTPLLIAVRRRNRPVVKALLAGGASPGVGGEKGEMPLHAACRLDDGETVATLLKAGAFPGHCWNDALSPPLLEACGAGSMDAVRYLLPHLSSRQVNLRDRVRSDETGGDTALLAAICSSRNIVEMVEALLEVGADPNIRSASTGESPLEAVLMNEAGAKDAELAPRLVRALVRAGVDVNEVGSKGSTALHAACYYGACGEVVQALLDAGADALAPCAGFHFYTPIQLASIGGSPGALRVMIEQPGCGGLNALGASPESSSALACAVWYGKTETVRFLLEEGADIDLLPFEDDGITQSTKSLLHMAVEQGHGDVASLLLQALRFRADASREARGAETPP